MKYLVYFHDEANHRLVESRDHRELEKWLTLLEETALTFKEEPEAGAVFFKDSAGVERGFYTEET